ncbi:MAG TPA: hypothetical protein VKU00_07545 [Chthonomonadaceae bacterium]|nr:hypothetical protein [Chthonomonadaceae bacterium]
MAAKITLKPEAEELGGTTGNKFEVIDAGENEKQLLAALEKVASKSGILSNPRVREVVILHSTGFGWDPNAKDRALTILAEAVRDHQSK